MQQTVLLVDDDDNILHGLARALRHQPYHLHTARSAEEAVWTLKTRAVDVIIADDRMPGMSGCDLLVWVAERYPDVIRIVLTGQGTMQTAVRAINEGGVYYFFTKPCDVVQLAMTIRKALEHKALLDENRRLAQLNATFRHFPEDLFEQLERLETLLGQGLCRPLEQMQEVAQNSPVSSAAQAAAEARQTVLRLKECCRPCEEVASEVSSLAE